MFNKQLIFFLFLLIAVYAVNARNIRGSGFDPEDFKQRMEAIKLNLQMRFGEHGKTVIAFQNDKQFLEINDERFLCDGTIQDNGECSGKLDPVNYDIKENFCYVQSKAKINGYVCLAGGKSIEMRIVNGKMVCESDNGKSPTLYIPLKEYKELCGNVADNPTFTYYADVNDPESVKIPNSNKYVTCMNNQPNVCEFKNKN